jgi:hypothetical protein
MRALIETYQARCYKVAPCFKTSSLLKNEFSQHLKITHSQFYSGTCSDTGFYRYRIAAIGCSMALIAGATGTEIS